MVVSITSQTNVAQTEANFIKPCEMSDTDELLH